MKAEILSLEGDLPIVEKPWHRLAIRLHLEGWTNTDIGVELHKSVTDVSLLITSPDAKKKIAQALEDDQSKIVGILEAAGIDSIYRLIILRDSASSEAVRFNSAKTLLEHGHGKPLVKIKKLKDDTNQDPQVEADRIKEELGLNLKEANAN
jgi:hypothetical protein